MAKNRHTSWNFSEAFVPRTNMVWPSAAKTNHFKHIDEQQFVLNNCDALPKSGSNDYSGKWHSHQSQPDQISFETNTNLIHAIKWKFARKCVPAKLTTVLIEIKLFWYAVCVVVCSYHEIGWPFAVYVFWGFCHSSSRTTDIYFSSSKNMHTLLSYVIKKSKFSSVRLLMQLLYKHADAVVQVSNALCVCKVINFQQTHNNNSSSSSNRREKKASILHPQRQNLTHQAFGFYIV